MKGKIGTLKTCERFTSTFIYSQVAIRKLAGEKDNFSASFWVAICEDELNSSGEVRCGSL
jgi:hypothetical protein